MSLLSNSFSSRRARSRALDDVVGPPTTVLYALDTDSMRRDVVELARQLDPLRFRMVFAALADPSGHAAGHAAGRAAGAQDVTDHLRSLGFPVLPCASGAAQAVRFRRLLHDVTPDVVHIAASRHVSPVLAASRAAGAALGNDGRLNALAK